MQQSAQEDDDEVALDMLEDQTSALSNTENGMLNNMIVRHNNE